MNDDNMDKLLDAIFPTLEDAQNRPLPQRKGIPDPNSVSSEFPSQAELDQFISDNKADYDDFVACQPTQAELAKEKAERINRFRKILRTIDWYLDSERRCQATGLVRHELVRLIKSASDLIDKDFS